METALKGVPVMEPSAPEGVVNVGGEWYYEEYARGGGVGSLGGGLQDNGSPALVPGTPSPLEDKSLLNSDGLPPSRPPSAPSEERRSILDLFRN
jgi:penicillin-binding protein 1A